MGGNKKWNLPARRKAGPGLSSSWRLSKLYGNGWRNTRMLDWETTSFSSSAISASVVSEASSFKRSHSASAEFVIIAGEELKQDATQHRRPSQRRSLQGNGFTLNQLNISGVKLVTREREITRLHRAFETSLATRNDPTGGHWLDVTYPTLVSIEGPPGVGKKRLALELKPVIDKLKGIFCTGKCYEQTREEPYAIFVDALADLSKKIAGESYTFRVGLRRSIEKSVGSDWRIISEQIAPGLAKTLNARDETENLLLDIERQHGKVLLFIRTLIRGVCRDGRPLAMLLQDVQWANSLSLDLLETLLMDTELPFLFLMAISCGTNLTSSNPYLCKLETLKSVGVDVITVNVDNLDMDGVSDLVATALRTPAEEVQGLSDIVFKKTHGNDYFAIQFLQNLVDKEHLQFNFGTLTWDWDEDACKALFVTENAAGLLMATMQRMSEQMQMMLHVAACLGDYFEEQVLVLVMKVTDICVFDNELPLDAKELLQAAVSDGVLERNGSKYSFAHIQLRDAAKRLKDEPFASSLSLRISKGLLEGDLFDVCTSSSDQELFDILELCNSTADLLDEGLKEPLAQHNLEAGRRAMKKATFSRALRYMEQGLSCLASIGTGLNQSVVMLSLTNGAANAAFCCGDFDKAESYIEAVVSADRPLVDKVDAYITWISIRSAQNRTSEAIDCGLSVLRRLGLLSLSKMSTDRDVLKELGPALKRLKAHDTSSLLQLPLLRDSRRVAGMSLIDKMLPMCQQDCPCVMYILAFRVVRWSIDYGVSSYSPTAFAIYGLYTMFFLGDHEEIRSMSNYTLQLSERLGAQQTLSRSILVIFGSIHPWFHDIRESRHPIRYGRKLALASNDIDCAMRSRIVCRQVLWISASRSLPKLAKDLEDDCHEMQRYCQDGPRKFLSCLWQMILNEMGESDDPLVLRGRAMDQQAMLVSARQSGNKALELVVFSYQMQLGYTYGAYEWAAEMLQQSSDLGTGCLQESLYSCRHFLYRGLVGLAMYGLGGKRRMNLRVANDALERLSKWNKHGNVNILHYVQLLKAEIQFHRKKFDKAEALYKEALYTSGRRGFVQDKGLIHTRAALFYLDVETSDRYWAAHHVDNAILCYHEWGAMGVVRHLLKRYVHILHEADHISDLVRNLLRNEHSSDS